MVGTVKKERLCTALPSVKSVVHLVLGLWGRQLIKTQMSKINEDSCSGSVESRKNLEKIA